MCDPIIEMGPERRKAVHQKLIDEKEFTSGDEG
jgi:hypothetical protein